MKTRIKTGDTVVVISGDEKGKRAAVLQVLPQKNRVLLEGINMVKKHQKETSQDGTSKEGGIVEREAPIHMSNVMLASRWDESRAAEDSADASDDSQDESEAVSIEAEEKQD